MLPTLGRIVLYRFRDGTQAPAIVTGVLDDMASLTVFPVGHLPLPLVGIMHDEGANPAPDTWAWPPREGGGPREIGLAGT
jgi:hypothetical protein